MNLLNITSLVYFFLGLIVFEKNIDPIDCVNIKDLGAIGDGITDDWAIIQKTVDKVASTGGGIIYFPAGEYATYDKSIVIWGENVSLFGDGNKKSKIIKKGKVGWFGECIDIAGKINNYKYFGNFGKGDYSEMSTYTGITEKAKNIHIKGLTISSDISKSENPIEKYNAANTLGIINSDQVFIEDCIIENAPQTNVGIINDTDLFSNGLIKFNNCVFRNSLQHNVRVISYNQGEFIGNNVEFDNCKFLNVVGEDQVVKELVGKKVLLWYRGSPKSGATSVKISNSNFDKSGIIYLNANVNDFFMSNTKVLSSMHVQHSIRHNDNPTIRIENSKFRNRGNASRTYISERINENSEKSLKNGFRKVDFGTVFPATLNIENR